MSSPAETDLPAISMQVDWSTKRNQHIITHTKKGRTLVLCFFVFFYPHHLLLHLVCISIVLSHNWNNAGITNKDNSWQTGLNTSKQWLELEFVCLPHLLLFLLRSYNGNNADVLALRERTSRQLIWTQIKINSLLHKKRLELEFFVFFVCPTPFFFFSCLSFSLVALFGSMFSNHVRKVFIGQGGLFLPHSSLCFSL